MSPSLAANAGAAPANLGSEVPVQQKSSTSPEKLKAAARPGPSLSLALPLGNGACAHAPTANADGRRSVIEPEGTDMPQPDCRRPVGELPPLLKSILQEYSATGMPPAYLPKTSQEDSGERS